MSHPNLDKLNEKITRLKQLVDDPHPGLISWRMAFYRAVAEASGELDDYAPTEDAQRPMIDI